MKKLLLLLNAFCLSLSATTWKVGSSQTYTTPGAIGNLVQDSDTIKIDAGIYLNDPVIWNKKNLVFIGLGVGSNRSIIKWNGGDIPNGKGLWVFANTALTGSITIENIVFEGARVSDANGGNGAGIRYQVKNLTVRNCLFSSCQNGILEGGSYSGSIVSIIDSEFKNNGYEVTGAAHSGYEHSIYISAQTDSLLVQNCYFHDPRGEGNMIKTRAQKSFILYNRIDEAAGQGSWEINIAQGGLSVIIGNTIIQGPSSVNRGIISYDAATNSIQNFYFINNTVINKYPGNFRYFNVTPTNGINVFKVYNNIFAKVSTGNMTSFITGTLNAALDTMSNRIMSNYNSVGFADPSTNDFHLTATSFSFIDHGSAPGQASNAFSLNPAKEYNNFNSSLLPRTTNGSGIDIGAYEYGTITSMPENGANHSVRCFPNPVQNKITVVVPEEIVNENTEFIISDLTGREVKRNQISQVETDMQLGSELKPGIYFYSVLSNELKVSEGKLIIE